MQPKNTGNPPRETDTKTRGQASLLALVVSLVVLTAVMGLALGVVDGAYRSTEREPTERRIATSLAERLVSEEAGHTTRANVMNVTEIHTLTEQSFDRTYPVTRGTTFHVRLGNQTIINQGNPAGGTTVRRLVLHEHQQQVTQSVGDNSTIPTGTERATITVPPRVTATTIRANDRVVLHNPDGLTGSFEITLTDLESTRLHVEGGGAEAVTVTYTQGRTTPTKLVVTVDA